MAQGRPAVRPAEAMLAERDEDVKLLLTNDDGFDAPGLRVLERAVRDWAETIVVAPAEGKSGVGHQVTTDRPIPVKRVGAGRYSVQGSPADCARIGLTELAPDASWVLSGVNRGANLGADVYTSGTVAAAREAALLGCRAAAVSQYLAKGQELDWETVYRKVAPLLKRLLAWKLTQGEFWNVNLPHLASGDHAGVVACALDTGPLGVAYRNEGDAFHYRGEYHERPRQPGRDVDVCMSGRISVTRMVLDIAAMVPDLCGPGEGPLP